jgi:hypothetical protein
MLQGVSLSLSAAPHSLLSPRRSLRVIYTGRITTFGNSWRFIHPLFPPIRPHFTGVWFTPAVSLYPTCWPESVYLYTACLDAVMHPSKKYCYNQNDPKTCHKCPVSGNAYRSSWNHVIVSHRPSLHLLKKVPWERFSGSLDQPTPPNEVYLGKRADAVLFSWLISELTRSNTEVRFRRLHDSTLLPPVVWLWVSLYVIHVGNV